MIAVFTAWWFWISVVLFLLLVLSEAIENRILSSVSFVASLFAYQFLADVNLFGYFKESPSHLLFYVSGYLTFGLIWGVAKWWMFCHNSLDEFKTLKEDFFSTHNISGTAIPKNLVSQWNSYIGYGKSYPPKIKDHKARFMGWMSHWPISILWTLMDDVVRKLYTIVYNQISSTLQSISDKVFSGETVNIEK